MTKAQLKGVWKSLTELGWLDVIITNEDGIIADGAQRYKVCMEHKEFYAPILRLPIDRVTAKMIQQAKNKVRGKHEPFKDAKALQEIVDGDREEAMKEILAMDDDAFAKALALADPSSGGDDDEEKEEPPEQHVECPKCGFRFNPDNFMVDAIQKDLEAADVDAIIQAGSGEALDKKNLVRIDLSLETTPPEISDRVSGVSQAFGVGVDESVKFQVFKALEIAYDDNDMIYVTGDSGSGKTTFLKLLLGNEQKRGRNVANFQDLEVDQDEVVVEGLGGDLNEAMKLLSAAGMSEAFLFMRRYRELSDGQKYRYRLAKMLGEKADAYFIDELCTNLDRVMAKVIVFNLQKWARRENKMVVAASTHHDIIEDLNPDILIFKGFGEDAQIRYYPYEKREISLWRHMDIEPAAMADYDVLDRFHYLGNRPGFIIDKFKLTYREKTIGVVLYQTPFLSVNARNNIFPEYKNVTKKEIAKKVNAEVTRLSRIIIHPKFRGCGLAVKLVNETKEATGKRIVETIAAMARYNPFFEKAGFTNTGEMKLAPHHKRLAKLIKELGGDLSRLHSPTERQTWIDNLNKDSKDKLHHTLIKSLNGLRGQGGSTRTKGSGVTEAERIQAETAKKGFQALLGELLPVKRIYLYWLNPNWTPDDENKGDTP